MEISKKIGMAVAAAATVGVALYAVSKIKPDIRKSTYPFAMKDGTILYMDLNTQAAMLKRLGEITSIAN